MKISASLLSANFANLEREIIALESAGVDMLHIDVMDGCFVPNLTFGSKILKTIRKLTKLQLDVHLMIEKPELVIDLYVDSGADIITIHPESTIHLDRTLSSIRKNNVKSGIALLPSTSPNIIEYVIDRLDLILVMSVNPGFAGQDFLQNQIKKIEILAERIEQTKSEIVLSVDGGINEISGRDCIEAGAKCLVAGSFIFSKDNDYSKNVSKLKLIENPLSLS